MRSRSNEKYARRASRLHRRDVVVDVGDSGSVALLNGGENDPRLLDREAVVPGTGRRFADQYRRLGTREGGVGRGEREVSRVLAGDDGQIL